MTTRARLRPLASYHRARMADRGRQWWLELPDGTRRKIGPAGVLIGRSPDCDLVLDDDRASRRHAIVHCTADGVALVSLRRSSARGAPEHDASLVDGTQLSFPGLTVTVRASARVHDLDPSWVLRHSGGGIFGVDERGLSVGSGPDDDLRIADCPPRSALFSVAHGQLLLEARVSLSVSGRRGELVRLPADSAHRLSRGDVVHLGRAQISVIVGGVTHMGTTVGRGDGPAHDCAKLTSVRLQSLPRGGRLFVAFGGEPAVAYLAGRRCDLAACLLQPPGPYDAGELIPDEVVIERVWPDGRTARSAVGVLLHRLRRDLVYAGLDGAALVVRAEGGGATRFAVPPGASVVVE